MSDPDYTIPISNSNQSSSDNGRIEYGYKMLNPGDIVGKRYRVIKELGSGGFATTYLAIDIELGENNRCVVKQLQPRFNSQLIWESAKERFAKEATVLQWLGNHPQIPQLLAHFEENKQFYLIQEFIEGEEFEQEVHRQILNESEVISFLCDVLEILDFVHQQRVIHRDIKPSNLIRRKSDRKIALIDFGAVKEIGTLVFDSKQDTLQTQVIGTPGYMSPEQNHGKPVYSSDIYALGKTAIYALTGRSPIEWEDTDLEAENVTWQKVARVSKQFRAIIDKMTSPRPSERYHSAMAVLEDLQPMLAVGTTLQNRYAIVSYLGREGNICSYVVEDVQQEQESAYVLHKFKVQNAAKETRSLVSVTNRLQEALTTLAQLNNYERIPKIITSFIDKNNCYLVQEYIEGQNLAEIIRAKGNLSEAEVITFLQEATEVLSQIHKRQIIHGNIKPSNLIKRSSDGKIVLVNFGVIQTIANPIYDFQKGYIPPEQIAGRLSTSSDIYALGMTAIEALTGIAPENLDKNTETGAVLWQHKGRVSEELANILNKMVYLGQQQRYHSAAQVLKALSKIKGRSKIKPWYKYIFWSLGGLTLLIFGRYLWLQYEAILLFAQADLQLQSQQYEKAIDYYDDGFKKVKGKVRQFERAWLGKATALSHLKRYDEMLQTCDRALKIHQSVYFLNCRGLALEGLEKNQEALAAYNQAIRRDPEFFEALNNRGEVYAKLGETDKAIADFQKAIGVDEAKSYVPWNNLGKLYYKQKDYSKALEAYSQAVNLKEDYLPALIGLGNVEKSQGMYVEALDAYEQATKFYPKSYEAWYAKGLVQEALQQYEEAIRAYERAIALKPDWEIPIKALERVERILGR